jgi:diguanylate cyclase (GGDEF)-like protein
VTATQSSQPTGIPRRFRLLAILVVCLGACSAAVATGVLTIWPLPDSTRLVVVVAALTAARLVYVRLRLGAGGVTFDWVEAALVVGLVLVPGAVVVLAAGAATALALALHRTPVLKLLYRTSAAFTATMAAALIVHAVAGTPDPFGLRGALALVAGVAAYSFLNDVTVSGSVAVTEHLPPLAVLRAGLSTRLVTLGGSLVAAFSVLALARVHLFLLAVVPPVIWLMHQGYAGRLRARSERLAWQQIAAATHDLNDLNETRVIASAISGASTLFGADAVEVEVIDPEGGHVLSRGDGRGDPWLGAAGAHARAEETVIVEQLVDGGGQPLGELRLCFSGKVALGERETLALSMFAESLASALRNAQVHRHLRGVADRNAYEATHDALTGLSNRAHLLEAGAGLLPGASGVLALLLLDLDHFKEVNDTLGHAAGDLLLASAAELLSGGLREGELLARLGGDEFALLLPAASAEDAALSDAEQRAQDMLGRLRVPVVVDGMAITVEASVGIAVCAVDDAPSGVVAELLRRADVAMYEAKRSAMSLSCYDSARDDVSLDRLVVVAELRSALEQPDELFLYVQPCVDLESGDPIGAEALVRWKHPRRGLLVPSDFIPIVEQTDLIGPFTRYVIDRALDIVAGWREDGTDLPVAVNLSARSLLDRTLPSDIEALLGRHRVPADRLVLEITETVMMSELDVVEEVLGALRTLGVQLSVDDFGTGYSSLTFLARVPVNEVKIDRSFVDAMDTSPEAAAIVRTTIELARALDLRVIAEGVETREQRLALIQLGCAAAQGFHLSPPMPLVQATTVIRRARDAARRRTGVIDLDAARTRAADER